MDACEENDERFANGKAIWCKEHDSQLTFLSFAAGLLCTFLIDMGLDDDAGSIYGFSSLVVVIQHGSGHPTTNIRLGQEIFFGLLWQQTRYRL
jgi:hypothetical protein